MPEGVSGYGFREVRSSSAGLMKFLNLKSKTETPNVKRTLADEHELPETVHFTVFLTAPLNLLSWTFTLP
jgi:hypothetical protein